MSTTNKAKESPQILKARQKLQKHLAAADKHVNPDAIKAMKRLIERQLTRKQPDRIDLKAKNVTLFDENKHPAKSQSKFVSGLLRQLKHPSPKKKPKQLEGRVKAIPENEK